MRKFRLIFVVLFLLAAGLPAWAASSVVEADHVRVELVVVPMGMNRGEAADIALYFKLEPGWHIYWKNAGDAGEPPHLHWTLPEGIKAGPMEFPAPQRLPLGPLMDYGYENEVLFPLKLYVAQSAQPGINVLRAQVDWLVCQDRCIPGKGELETNLSIYDQPGKTVERLPDAALFRRLSGRLPKPLPEGSKLGFQATKDGFRLTVETGRREATALFFPTDEDLIDNPAPQKVTATAKGLVLDLKKDAALTTAPKQLRGVLELGGERAFEIVAGTEMAVAEAKPVSVALVGQSEEQKSENPPSGAKAPVDTTGSLPGLKPVPSEPSLPGAEQAGVSGWAALLRAVGLAFLGGLLLNLMPCVFPVLFLKGLALVNSGNEERSKLRAHGLVYAAGILISFWALVGVLLGLRAAGGVLGWGFQFQSPVFLALMAGLLFFLGLSLAGQFEVGLTLTSAGGSLAQKQGYTGSFFTGVLAVVVATPCTAPLMGPAIGYALAQSGVVTFGVFTALALGLAAPYVLLTMQPAWTHLLPRPGVWMEMLKQATAVPIFATVIWLAWVLAKAYGASVLVTLLAGFLLLAMAGWFLGRWPARRWATTVAAVLVLAVIGLAVYGSKLADEAGAPMTSADGWQPWSAEAVSRAQTEGRPVFVDFTASWCLSCQVNERVALNQPEVQAAFQTKHVVLLKADWTRHDEAITQALTALGRSGVPAYAYYAPGQTNPRLLPEALTPGIVLDALR
jgi:thiol:disulfide interchange protein DsbD